LKLLARRVIMDKLVESDTINLLEGECALVFSGDTMSIVTNNPDDKVEAAGLICTTLAYIALNRQDWMEEAMGTMLDGTEKMSLETAIDPQDTTPKK
jgi:hypothetical protein